MFLVAVPVRLRGRGDRRLAARAPRLRGRLHHLRAGDDHRQLPRHRAGPVRAARGRSRLQVLHRLRREETSATAPRGSSPTGRRGMRWAASHLAVALGARHGLPGGRRSWDRGRLRPSAVAGSARCRGSWRRRLVYLPAVGFLTALGFALFGLAPRWFAGAWAALVGCLAIGVAQRALRPCPSGCSTCPHSSTPRACPPTGSTRVLARRRAHRASPPASPWWASSASALETCPRPEADPPDRPPRRVRRISRRRRR